MDTFTHHLSVNGHGGTIGTVFPINEGSVDDSSPQRIYFASPLYTRAITTVPPLSKVSSDLIPAAPIWLRFTYTLSEAQGFAAEGYAVGSSESADSITLSSSSPLKRHGQRATRTSGPARYDYGFTPTTIFISAAFTMYSTR